MAAASRVLPMCPDKSVTHVPGCTDEDALIRGLLDGRGSGWSLFRVPMLPRSA